MSFKEPARRDPRLAQGRGDGGIYVAKAVEADQRWALKCGNQLRGPKVDQPLVPRSSVQREAAADVFRKHRAAIERQETPQYKRFAKDIKTFQTGIARMRSGMVSMQQLNDKAILLHCRHGYHQRCSH